MKYIFFINYKYKKDIKSFFKNTVPLRYLVFAIFFAILRRITFNKVILFKLVFSKISGDFCKN